ncbi:FCD domain-containing protein [Arthrobacter sp. JZ12]|uniref:GntR family transcriptional regulator n=1 Tax=Arthrobacter sp. JZ12 TaxID=2654190 RepID=UPI002B49017C|nr:GntR family transcriptional regulator [Arthrobacter sp. JZ12]WRH24283.1 FCD domain-containing protein [Arthrobacter sp. JZ12]
MPPDTGGQRGADEDTPPKQRVQDEIRRDIIFGTLPPGTRVTETALATKYGISRVPVREALRALEAEGFVESKPYAGSTVSKIPVDDAEDLFFVREALESATARRAARRAAAQFDLGAPSADWWQARKALAGILDEGDRAVAQNRLELLPELNIRFHLGVAELSGSASLTALLRQIAGKIEWLYATDVDTRGKESWGEHRTILAAIDAGNFAEAERLMAHHVHQSKEGYLDRFASEVG